MSLVHKPRSSSGLAFSEKWYHAILCALLVFRLELLERAGHKRGKLLKSCLLAQWKYTTGFTDYSRCLYYSMCDTTSLWVAFNWLRKRSSTRKGGPELLMNLVVAVVCLNHHSVLQHIPGAYGFTLNAKAIDFC